jgi:ABC-type polysaccharide/polyol phosphate transport system ATPase subunit
LGLRTRGYTPPSLIQAGSPLTHLSAVEFERVSKRFTIHHERARSFQDLLIRRFRRSRTSEEFWALRDVSFGVEPGTSLGVVGANGSGKSTLLKLVTRILAPTTGKVAVNGRVSALLELGAGFHPELTGRDNIFLNASILGMQRAEVARRFDAIVKFSGLERFIDTPVKNYSSGMYARLGFAVAINVDPDILLIDEVLSVGDESFHERCLEAIHRFHRRGKTLLLVSHDVNAVRNICTQVIWLEDGRIRARGEPGVVVSDYVAAAHESADLAAEDPAELPDEGELEAGHRWGSGEAEILDVCLTDAAGKEVSRVHAGEPLGIQVRYRAHTRLEDVVFGLAIATGNDVLITGPNTRNAGYAIPAIEGEGCITYRVEQLPLNPGEYWISASIYDQSCTHPYDYHDRMYPMMVVPGRGDEPFGIVHLAARWCHESSVSASQSNG